MPQGTPGSPPTTEQNLDHAGGFAKVFRKLWDHPNWQDPYRLRAWLDCILLAYWRDYRVMWHGRRVLVRRGQFLTSYRILSKRWGRSRQFVIDFLATGEEHGELVVEKSRTGCRVTVVNYDKYHGSDDTSHDTQMSPRCHPDDTIEEVQEVQEATTPDGPVDNSVDNLSMPRMVAEVMQAFHQASGTMKPPSAPDRLAIEKAIGANGGSHIAIREYVRKATADGVAYAAKVGSDPPRSVRYGLAAWNRRNERSPDPRPEKREPESRPQHPPSHERVRPVPTRPMTDEESRAGAENVAAVIARLKLRPDRSKK